jgi:hypothetical protein
MGIFLIFVLARRYHQNPPCQNAAARELLEQTARLCKTWMQRANIRALKKVATFCEQKVAPKNFVNLEPGSSYAGDPN